MYNQQEKNYTRQKGDDLLSKDKRLRYKWEWSRIASGIDEEELKKWTHFQCSQCKVGNWHLRAIQWGHGEDVSYEAEISYNNSDIISQREFKTRLEAEIGAEKLLYGWLETECQRILKWNYE